MRYTVRIKRTETYVNEIGVEAENEEEALRLAERANDRDELADDWEELYPDVKTEYHVEAV